MALTAGHRWLASAIGVGLVAAVVSAVALVRLVQISAFNQDLASERYESASGDSSSYGIFARAYLRQLDREYDAAIGQYARIENSPDTRFRERVRYNMATLYMQRAMDIRQSGSGGDITPLVELAKYHYKALLRADPGNWSAKYNLEQALKLSPDLLEKEIPEDVMPERSPEAAGAITIDRALP